jgi:hypothetical protein
MSYNLQSVRSRIEQKLDDTSFGAAKLNQFINDGIRDILNARRFRFMEREATIQTVIGDSTVTGVPIDLEVPISLRIYNPKNKAIELTYVEYEDFDTVMANPNNVSNTVPAYWRVFNGDIFVYPNADAVYDLKLKYLKSVGELVNDTDVPEIPESFSELVVLAGYKRALEHNDDYDQAQLIQQQVDIQVDNMDERFKRQMGLPHVMRQPNRNRRVGRTIGGI